MPRLRQWCRAKVRPLDILINNAGIRKDRPLFFPAQSGCFGSETPRPSGRRKSWFCSTHSPRADSAKRRVNIPITIAPEALDFTQLIRAGEIVGLAEATAEPVFLTRMLDTQAQRCPPFRLSALIELDERL